jgi:GTP-dependent dephospho-CoA kinase
MKIAYTLTPKLAAQFKNPFGTLIEGTPDKTMATLKEMVAAEKPPMLISVGDVVSRNLHVYGLHPLLSVIDNVSLRDQKEATPQIHGEKVIAIKNAPGTITQEAIKTIKAALTENDHTHIVVEGEEDLLVITAVQYAPLNAFVVYGQPHCGIVVVKVTAKRKADVRGFLKVMRPAKS